MKKSIQFIAIAILAGISFLTVSAREQTLVINTDGPATTAQAEPLVPAVNKVAGQRLTSNGFNVGGTFGYPKQV